MRYIKFVIIFLGTAILASLFMALTNIKGALPLFIFGLIGYILWRYLDKSKK